MLEEIIWPVSFAFAAVIIVIAFFFIFKKSIEILLGRIKSLGRKDVKFSPMEDKPQDDSGSDADIKNRLMRLGDLPVFSAEEENIKRDIRDKKLSDKESVAILTRHYAVLQVCLSYEVVYRHIFNSQVHLLRKINAHSMSEKSIRDFFEIVRRSHSNAFENWTFEHYVDFLLRFELMGNQKGVFFITEKGRGFLSWMAMQGYPEKENF